MRIEVNIYYLTIKPTETRRNRQGTFPTNSLLQTQNTDGKRSINTTLATFTTKTRNQSSSETIPKDSSTSSYTRRTISSAAVKSIIL